MTKPISPPLKWHGGKHYHAGRIIGLMPPHTTYVEAFAGGLSVLLGKNPEGVCEVANDLDGDLSNFWDVLRCPDRSGEFIRRASVTPFSARAFAEAAAILDRHPGDPDGPADDVTRAWAFFVQCRQSLAGRREDFAPISKTRTRRGMCEQASAWLSAVEGLPAVRDRLARVAILNRNADEVVRAYDEPGVLIYADPPYLPRTRTAPSVYRQEMGEDAHGDLLFRLAGLKHARFVLSGYRSEMYDAAADAHGWRRVDWEVPNHAAGGKAKRAMVECVWMNYPEGEAEAA